MSDLNLPVAFETRPVKANVPVYSKNSRGGTEKSLPQEADIYLLGYRAPVAPEAKKGNGVSCNITIDVLAAKKQRGEADPGLKLSAAEAEPYFIAMNVDPKECGQGTTIYRLY